MQRKGKIDQKQWTDFYLSFVTPFENADTDPRDSLLTEEEVKKSLENIPNTLKSITENTRPTYLAEIIETIQSRVSDKPGLNLNEFIFLRRAAVAWSQCMSSA